MTYATTYHIGDNQLAPRVKTKGFASTVEQVRRLDAKNKGCKRNPQGQTATCTTTHVANGFLRTSFLPRLKETENLQACTKTAKTERDFYTSLSRLADHYRIDPMQTRAFGYPYNIALALWDTKKKLKNKVRNWEEIRLVQDSKKIFFTSEERYNTGATLYYIPVVPLYRMLQNPERKQAAQLLLSVCAYLYHVADIPYYRQENSFLYWQYEMLKEWALSDDYTEETPSYMSEIAQAEWIGERMEQKIYNHNNLSRFQERLNHFKCNDSLDRDCLKLAHEIFSLYGQYPHETVFRNASPKEEAEEVDEDDMYNLVTMDKYISFYADGKGSLNENLIQGVNNELQEYGQTQEPVLLKRFDRSNITGNSLDFENRLFTMMDELIYLLNNF
jgi:hypothetical protein